MYDCGRRRWVSGKADEWRDMTMRLIDANALLEKLNKEKVPYRRDIDKVIREMTVYAPIINKPQWIPVAERLPDYDPDPGEYFPMLIIFTKRDGVTPGFYNECTKKWFACELRTCVFAETAEEDVIAWMPMPEPYEPDGTKMKADWQ